MWFAALPTAGARRKFQERSSAAVVVCSDSILLLAVSELSLLYYKYKKQLQKIERKVGMEYQKAYKQG